MSLLSPGSSSAWSCGGTLLVTTLSCSCCMAAVVTPSPGLTTTWGDMPTDIIGWCAMTTRASSFVSDPGAPIPRMLLLSSITLFPGSRLVSLRTIVVVLLSLLLLLSRMMLLLLLLFFGTMLLAAASLLWLGMAVMMSGWLLLCAPACCWFVCTVWTSIVHRPPVN